MTTLAELGVTDGAGRLVAEIGNCRGDYDWAVEALERCAVAGLWGVKVQLYTADNLTTRDAPTYGNPDEIAEPGTQAEHFAAPFPVARFPEFVKQGRALGVEVFASVFDETHATLARAAGVRLWKVASADITHKRLIQHIARFGQPIVLSTGAATIDEINRAYRWIGETSPLKGDHEVLPLMCTLAYPCPPEEAHVARVTEWREKVGMCGYSDHTRGVGGVDSALAAGAAMVEKHVTVTPGVGGDHDFAVTPEELAATSPITRPVYMGSRTIGPHPIEELARRYARRSLVANLDIPRGARLTAGMFDALRPGTGVEPWMIDEDNGPVGQKAAIDISAGTVLLPGMYGRFTASLTVE